MDSLYKTLVVRFSSIGDIVLTSPFFRVFRKEFPGTVVDVLTKTEFAPLLRHNRNINRVFEYDADDGIAGLMRLKKELRAQKYDLVVDLHGSLRSRYVRRLGARKVVAVNKRIRERRALIKRKKNIYNESLSVAQRYIETVSFLDVEDDGLGTELTIPADIADAVNERITPLLKGSAFGFAICPGAKHLTKRWPEERFASAGARIVRQLGGRAFIFGGPEDEALCSRIAEKIVSTEGADAAVSFAGSLTLLETASALAHLRYAITNDTGLMHIAEAMGVPVFALFGPTVREFGFFPQRNDSIVLERNGLYCRPCSHIGLEKCPEGHFRCMTEVETEDLLAEVFKKHWMRSVSA